MDTLYYIIYYSRKCTLIVAFLRCVYYSRVPDINFTFVKFSASCIHYVYSLN